MLTCKNGLPALTFHAVNLGESFANPGDVLVAFAAGAPGREGRERDAILAAIVKAFLGQDIEIADLENFQGDRQACSRLLYACLLAQAFNWDADADLYLLQMAGFLEKSLAEQAECRELSELFIEMPIRHAKRTAFEERARIRQGVCLADIRKMI